MRSFIQYIKAIFFGWKPKIGAIYVPYRKEDPFKVKDSRVVVREIRKGYVRYEYLAFPNAITSSSIHGFASYFFLENIAREALNQKEEK